MLDFASADRLRLNDPVCVLTPDAAGVVNVVQRHVVQVLGDGVLIGSSVRANPLGLPHPSALRALARGAQLILGPGVGMSGSAVCAGAAVGAGPCAAGTPSATRGVRPPRCPAVAAVAARRFPTDGT